MNRLVSPQIVGAFLLVALSLGPTAARADLAPGVATSLDPCGVWVPLAPTGTLPLGRSGHVSVYDAGNDRMIVYGGSAGPLPLFTDIWALSFAGTPSWTQLLPSGVPPAQRWGMTAIYDPVRQRMILHGGRYNVPTVFNDVWALSLSGSPAWTQLTPLGTPPAAGAPAQAVYDAVRDRMLVYGGETGNEVWALTLSGTPTWSQLIPAGTPPTPAVTVVYDPVRDRIVGYGGWSSYPSSPNNTWELSLAGTPTWTQIASNSPPGFEFYSGWSAYDPVGDRMVVLGLIPESYGTYRNFLVAQPLASATPATRLPSVSAPALNGVTFVYDSSRHRFVIFGGSETGYSNTTYVIRHEGPTLIADVSPYKIGSVIPSPNNGCFETGAVVTITAVPPAGYGFGSWSGDASGTANPTTVTMDGTKNVVANFITYHLQATMGSCCGDVSYPYTGYNIAPGTVIPLTAIPETGYRFLNWSGDASGSQNPLYVTMDGDKTIHGNFTHEDIFYCMYWTVSPDTTPKPSDRSGYAAAYDPVRHRLWMFGGVRTAVGTLANDWWSFDLSTNTWAQLVIAGTPPPGLVHAAAVYDGPRDRLILFGGEDASAAQHAEVWAVNLTGTPTWTQIPVAGPAGRSRHVAVYDATRERMLIHGGGSSSAPLGDVWALDLSGIPAWTALPGTLARTNHAAIYDPVRDRMLSFGGHDTGALIINTVSQLPLSDPTSWETLDPAGAPPNARFGSMAAYDPYRDQMVVYGGQTAGGGSPTDARALKLTDQVAWFQLVVGGTAPTSSPYKEAIFDTNEDAFVFNIGPSSRVARLSFSGGYAIEVTVDPPGTGTVSKNPGGRCLEPGASMTLTATPTLGYEFQEWRDLGSTQNPLTFTADNHQLLIAQFAPTVGVGDEAAAGILLDVAPNPSFGPTRIGFALPLDGPVQLTVHDIAGREVSRLADGVRPAGRHDLEWSPGDQRLPAGVYFLRLEFADRIVRKRLVFMR